MSASGIGASGDMYLVFSGDDYLAIRKGTIAAGFLILSRPAAWMVSDRGPLKRASGPDAVRR